MSRLSANEYRDGVLWAGYDYENQAWVEDGKYLTCGHTPEIRCTCYGRMHEGMPCTQPEPTSV